VRWPVGVGRPVETLKDADQEGGRVDLASVDSVPCQSGVGVVGVVPRIAEAKKCKRREVGAAIAGAEGPTAEHVSDRVDRPCDVMQQENAHASGPQQGRQSSGEGAGQ
jgi:hypothetical protein